ncbi:hypothetical protein EQO05_05560 [Methanosarcina sp. MSH10X1]|uniref:hypothetical protein n=1 Tax=Methanosarcina sp. MSH10X1 TaxID=2507075 RepID=UPI000FFB55A2|nr:hypothetical protein [Methanosarcina sp. MSH10X1]RXA20582.1 hypothetical protein EQO05_05560 [Methanosarcina sp. MSH10X1]
MNEERINKNFLHMYSLYKSDCIEGNLKFEKLCYELKESLIENSYKCGQNFDFERNKFGPREDGLSKANIKFEMMGLIEIEKELGKKPVTYKIKEKGKLWVESLKKFYNKTVPDFSSIISVADNSLEENYNLSGTQIVKKERVQKAKEEMWGKKV